MKRYRPPAGQAMEELGPAFFEDDHSVVSRMLLMPAIKKRGVCKSPASFPCYAGRQVWACSTLTEFW
jgi:hypothetical protein